MCEDVGARMFFVFKYSVVRHKCKTMNHVNNSTGVITSALRARIHNNIQFRKYNHILKHVVAGNYDKELISCL